jgi:hypothetical protein
MEGKILFLRMKRKHKEFSLEIFIEIYYYNQNKYAFRHSSHFTGQFA